MPAVMSGPQLIFSIYNGFYYDFLKVLRRLIGATFQRAGLTLPPNPTLSSGSEPSDLVILFNLLFG